MTAAARGRGRPSAGADAADTRAQILAAARTSFAAAGFSGTTVRGVARAAGVDPALVHHYFGTKADLFLAALDVPFDPRALLPEVLAGDLDGVAARLLGTVLGVWDEERGRLQLAAVARTTLAAPVEHNPFREGLLPLILAPIRARLEQHPELAATAGPRAQLAASQVVGIVVMRYLVQAEPMASMKAGELVGWVAPVLQRYLTGPAPAGPG